MNKRIRLFISTPFLATGFLVVVIGYGLIRFAMWIKKVKVLPEPSCKGNERLMFSLVTRFL